jgi:hypothetical protein
MALRLAVTLGSWCAAQAVNTVAAKGLVWRNASVRRLSVEKLMLYMVARDACFANDAQGNAL